MAKVRTCHSSAWLTSLRLSILLVLLAICGMTLGQDAKSSRGPSPAKLKAGDVVSIQVEEYKDYSGDFAVQNDGSIYAPGVGRLVVEGLTLRETERLVTKRLGKYLRNPHPFVLLKEQRRDLVYVSSEKAGTSEIPLGPNVDLRRVVASSVHEGQLSDTEVVVYRKGVQLTRTPAIDLMNGASTSWNGPLRPDDLVILNSVKTVRVWISGGVRAPGQLDMKSGDDVYRTVASAGDVAPSTLFKKQDYQIRLRRGAEIYTFPATQENGYKPFAVEPGDFISVDPPKTIFVTVAGAAKSPGQFELRDGTSLVEALGKASGVTDSGTWHNVLLFRGGDVKVVDALQLRDHPQLDPVVLHDGDFVYVQPSARTFYVLGAAARPGRFVMQENRDYTLADALAEAGGLMEGGTLRRMAILSVSQDGTFTKTIKNLDEFIKDGKLSSNPKIHEGDYIFVDSSRGLTVDSATRVLSSFLFFQTFFKIK